jgi:hypothetical protein
MTRLRTLAARTAAAIVLSGLVGAPSLAAPNAVDPLEKQGWTYLASTADMIVYMKLEEASADGDVRRARTLYNSLTKRQREDYDFMSVDSLAEYDCAQMKQRVIAETFYEQPALKGQTHQLGGPIPTPWEVQAPGSIGEIKYQFACDVKPTPTPGPTV